MSPPATHTSNEFIYTKGNFKESQTYGTDVYDFYEICREAI